jgi:hypothetical protein
LRARWRLVSARQTPVRRLAARVDQEPGARQRRNSAQGDRQVLLDTVSDHLRTHGEWDEVAGLLAAALARGSSASRQRMLAHARGDLTEVTRTLVDETTRHAQPPLDRRSAGPNRRGTRPADVGVVAPVCRDSTRAVVAQMPASWRPPLPASSTQPGD